MSNLADSVQLEARIQIAAQKCAKHAADNGGNEDPDLLVEYGQALFAMAKLSASLLEEKNVEDKQLPYENPKVKIADLGEEVAEEEEEENENANEKEDSGDKAENENAGDDEEAEQEDVEGEEEGAGDDFEEAFQIVDLARVIYEKQPESESRLIKLANVRALLGEISLEDDNPEQSIEDFTAASEYKKQVYGPDSGEFSEAEFMLSLAYDSVGKTSDALIHIEEAAKAARKAGLKTAEELEQRAKDAKNELELAEKLKGKDKSEAKLTTKESISGRQAISNAVKSMVSGANDISQLTRKRKRNTEPKESTESKEPKEPKEPKIIKKAEEKE